MPRKKTTKDEPQSENTECCSDYEEEEEELDTEADDTALHSDASSEGGDDSGGDIDGGESEPELAEDGLDMATHGGGTLESVEGFEFENALTEGFGPQVVEIDEELSQLPRSCDLEFSETPESVCGRDDRVRINGTTRVPWRMICQLIITRRDNRMSRCTGWFIGPGTVMTAGHCVYSHAAGGWAKKIEVVPGMNASRRPFGSVVGTRFHSVTGWTRKGKATHDYGCIILSNKLGRRTGWFGFAALTARSLRNLLINNSGYAGDKPFGTQWFNAGRITRVTSRRLYYMLDTYGGHSGSPTWRYRNGKRHAVGVHAYGGCPNKSTRITKPVFDNMKRWKQLGN